MIKKIISICAVLLFAMYLSGCGIQNTDTEPAGEFENAAGLLTEVKTTQYFTDEQVPDDDIEKILSAGINAPSAMNTQPWHFTAITNDDVTQKLADAMKSMKPPTASNIPAKEKTDTAKTSFSKAATKAAIGDAPLTIVISCEDGAELSTGLAVQNMSVEAQLLGYGTKILTSPTIALNGDNQAEYNELLKIPENQKTAAVLIVGKAAEDDDAVSSATERNSFDTVTSIIR